MPRHHFTLAALATTAVPGIDVVRAQAFTGGGDGAFDAALLTTAEGRHLVIRQPTEGTTDARLDAERRALESISAGVRSRLPFAVPEVVGASADGALPKVLVTSYLPGTRMRTRAVQVGSPLTASAGAAIAALHGLPPSAVAGGTLPVETGASAVHRARELIDGATTTGRVPRALEARWREALDAGALWQYTPTVVHGSLAAESLLVQDEAVTGVLGWSALHVGDPARDLAWCLALPGGGAATSIFATYHHARRGDADRSLRQRATLHAELELARWLRYGDESGQREVVDDATAMLRVLDETVARDTVASLVDEPVAALSVGEVERMLSVPSPVSRPDTGPIRTVHTSPVPLPTVAQSRRNSASE